MNRIPTLATILLILISASLVCLGQEKTKAVLVDEFGKVTCDDFLARADNFFMQVHANPSARGYFVIGGSNALLRGKLSWEAELNAAVAERMPDRTRLIEVRGPETGDFKLQFWIVPQGMVVPDFKVSIWNFSLPHETKPFIINTEFSEMCGAPVNPSVIRSFLSANPAMKAHAVIYANTSGARRKGLMAARISLKTIPANRVRYFFAKSPGYSIPLAEYWLVPAKKK